MIEKNKEASSGNIADREQISLDTKTQKSEARSYLRKRIIPVIICVLLISFGLGMYFAVWNISQSNFADAIMYNYGNILYFSSIRNNVKFYSYDPVSKKIKKVINEPVYSFYANDEYYFYACKSGFYRQNRITKERIRIVEFGKEIPERQKWFSGEKLLDTPASENCAGFRVHNGSLYFVYYIGISLSPSEHSVIGHERWYTLYRLDMETMSLTEIKRNHGIDDFLKHHFKDNSIFNTNIIGNMLYYNNGTEVHCLSLDGKRDDIIYRSAGEILRLDWLENVFYCFENKGKNQLESEIVAEELEMGYCVNAINLEGEVITSYVIPSDFKGKLSEIPYMYYDARSNSYFALYNRDKVINFSLDNPREYSTVAVLEQTRDKSAYGIIMLDGSLFLYAYGMHDYHNKNYYILSVNDRNEAITLVKNGKVVSK